MCITLVFRVEMPDTGHLTTALTDVALNMDMVLASYVSKACKHI